MTNAPASAIMKSTNPVLTVAPLKEDTEMSGATNKITALYCRLSQDDDSSNLYTGEKLYPTPGRGVVFCY